MLLRKTATFLPDRWELNKPNQVSVQILLKKASVVAILKPVGSSLRIPTAQLRNKGKDGSTNLIVVQRVLWRGRVGRWVRRRELPDELFGRSRAGGVDHRARRLGSPLQLLIVARQDRRGSVRRGDAAGVDRRRAGRHRLVDDARGGGERHRWRSSGALHLLRVHRVVVVVMVMLLALAQLAADKPDSYHRAVAPDHPLALQVQPREPLGGAAARRRGRGCYFRPGFQRKGCGPLGRVAGRDSNRGFVGAYFNGGKVELSFFSHCTRGVRDIQSVNFVHLPRHRFGFFIVMFVI